MVIETFQSNYFSFQFRMSKEKVFQQITCLTDNIQPEELADGLSPIGILYILPLFTECLKSLTFKECLKSVASFY